MVRFVKPDCNAIWILGWIFLTCATFHDWITSIVLKMTIRFSWRWLLCHNCLSAASSRCNLSHTSSQHTQHTLTVNAAISFKTDFEYHFSRRHSIFPIVNIKQVCTTHHTCVMYDIPKHYTTEAIHQLPHSTDPSSSTSVPHTMSRHVIDNQIHCNITDLAMTLAS